MRFHCTATFRRTPVSPEVRDGACCFRQMAQEGGFCSIQNTERVFRSQSEISCVISLPQSQKILTTMTAPPTVQTAVASGCMPDFPECVRNSTSDIPMRSMFCSSKNRASLSVRSPSSSAQCLSEERFMI